MKYIFYIIGKSAAGKDSIYNALIKDKELKLKPVLLSTTRPMREGEAEGREYHFVNEEEYSRMKARDEVLECRTYDTVHGPWRYFTVSTAFDEGSDYYLGIGTLESFNGIRSRFGKERMIPVYIEVEDGERLIRAIGREKNSGRPDYKEMCRRYIADDDDFSEEKLLEAGVDKEYRFENTDLTACTEKIRSMIVGYQGK